MARDDRAIFLQVRDGHDFVAPHATGRLHLGHIALLLADQGTGNRAADVDQAQFEVGLVLAHDLVLDLVTAVLVFEHHGGAKHHTATGIE